MATGAALAAILVRAAIGVSTAIRSGAVATGWVPLVLSVGDGVVAGAGNAAEEVDLEEATVAAVAADLVDGQPGETAGKATREVVGAATTAIRLVLERGVEREATAAEIAAIPIAVALRPAVAAIAPTEA